MTETKIETFVNGTKGGAEGGTLADDRIVINDTIFVSGFPKSVTETEIETFFGSVGAIKVTRTSSLLEIFSIDNPHFIVNLD